MDEELGNIRANLTDLNEQLRRTRSPGVVLAWAVFAAVAGLALLFGLGWRAAFWPLSISGLLLWHNRSELARRREIIAQIALLNDRLDRR